MIDYGDEIFGRSIIVFFYKKFPTAIYCSIITVFLLCHASATLRLFCVIVILCSWVPLRVPTFLCFGPVVEEGFGICYSINRFALFLSFYLFLSCFLFLQPSPLLFYPLSSFLSFSLSLFLFHTHTHTHTLSLSLSLSSGMRSCRTRSRAGTARIAVRR